jgi:diacylglycerol kinase family enzyme
MNPRRAPFLLVGNPSAQSGKNAERIARARRLLDESGLRHDFLSTVPCGMTIPAVRDALADLSVTTVIAMGGDGTFAEVAKGLFASGRTGDVRFGMLPTGTANDQGKSFGLAATPDALPRNVLVLKEGYETKLDVGSIKARSGGKLVHEDLFFDSAGFGISPRVLAVRNEDRRQIEAIPIVREVFRDHAVYAGALFKTFLASYVQDQKFDARAVVDGRTVEWKGLTDLIVKGTRVYGGMWIFDPTSRHDDGQFELIPFVGKRDWTSKAMLHLDQTGQIAENLARIGVTHSQLVRGAEIDLELSAHDEPIFGQIDGEEFPGSEQVEIRVLPRAMRLIVPHDYAAAYEAG